MRLLADGQVSAAAAFPKLEIRNFPRLVPAAAREQVGSPCQGIRAAASQGKAKLCTATAFPCWGSPSQCLDPALSVALLRIPSSSPLCMSSDALFSLMSNEIGGTVWPDSIVMDNAMQIDLATYEPPSR